MYREIVDATSVDDAIGMSTLLLRDSKTTLTAVRSLLEYLHAGECSPSPSSSEEDFRTRRVLRHVIKNAQARAIYNAGVFEGLVILLTDVLSFVESPREFINVLPELLGGPAAESSCVDRLTMSRVLATVVASLKEVLSGDRALLVPVIGCLAELPLTLDLTIEVRELTLDAIHVVEEMDLPVVVRALLRIIMTAGGGDEAAAAGALAGGSEKTTTVGERRRAVVKYARKIVAVIRGECSRLKDHTEAVLVEVLRDALNSSAGGGTAVPLFLEAIGTPTNSGGGSDDDGGDGGDDGRVEVVSVDAMILLTVLQSTQHSFRETVRSQLTRIVRSGAIMRVFPILRRICRSGVGDDSSLRWLPLLPALLHLCRWLLLCPSQCFAELYCREQHPRARANGTNVVLAERVRWAKSVTHAQRLWSHVAVVMTTLFEGHAHMRGQIVASLLAGCGGAGPGSTNSLGTGDSRQHAARRRVAAGMIAASGLVCAKLLATLAERFPEELSPFAHAIWDSVCMKVDDEGGCFPCHRRAASAATLHHLCRSVVLTCASGHASVLQSNLLIQIQKQLLRCHHVVAGGSALGFDGAALGVMMASHLLHCGNLTPEDRGAVLRWSLHAIKAVGGVASGPTGALTMSGKSAAILGYELLRFSVPAPQTDGSAELRNVLPQVLWPALTACRIAGRCRIAAEEDSDGDDASQGYSTTVAYARSVAERGCEGGQWCLSVSEYVRLHHMWRFPSSRTAPHGQQASAPAKAAAAQVRALLRSFIEHTTARGETTSGSRLDDSISGGDSGAPPLAVPEPFSSLDGMLSVGYQMPDWAGAVKARQRGDEKANKRQAKAVEADSGSEMESFIMSTAPAAPPGGATENKTSAANGAREGNAKRDGKGKGKAKGPSRRRRRRQQQNGLPLGEADGWMWPNTSFATAAAGAAPSQGYVGAALRQRYLDKFTLGSLPQLFEMAWCCLYTTAISAAVANSFFWNWQKLRRGSPSGPSSSSCASSSSRPPESAVENDRRVPDDLYHRVVWTMEVQTRLHQVMNACRAHVRTRRRLHQMGQTGLNDAARAWGHQMTALEHVALRFGHPCGGPTDYISGWDEVGVGAAAAGQPSLFFIDPRLLATCLGQLRGFDAPPTVKVFMQTCFSNAVTAAIINRPPACPGTVSLMAASTPDRNAFDGPECVMEPLLGHEGDSVNSSADGWAGLFFGEPAAQAVVSVVFESIEDVAARMPSARRTEAGVAALQSKAADGGTDRVTMAQLSHLQASNFRLLQAMLAHVRLGQPRLAAATEPPALSCGASQLVRWMHCAVSRRRTAGDGLTSALETVFAFLVAQLARTEVYTLAVQLVELLSVLTLDMQKQVHVAALAVECLVTVFPRHQLPCPLELPKRGGGPLVSSSCSDYTPTAFPAHLPLPVSLAALLPDQVQEQAFHFLELAVAEKASTAQGRMGRDGSGGGAWRPPWEFAPAPLVGWESSAAANSDGDGDDGEAFLSPRCASLWSSYLPATLSKLFMGVTGEVGGATAMLAGTSAADSLHMRHILLTVWSLIPSSRRASWASTLVDAVASMVVVAQRASSASEKRKRKRQRASRNIRTAATAAASADQLHLLAALGNRSATISAMFDAIVSLAIAGLTCAAPVDEPPQRSGNGPPAENGPFCEVTDALAVCRRLLLVAGHCIIHDPYYVGQRAASCRTKYRAEATKDGTGPGQFDLEAKSVASAIGATVAVLSLAQSQIVRCLDWRAMGGFEGGDTDSASWHSVEFIEPLLHQCVEYLHVVAAMCKVLKGEAGVPSCAGGSRSDRTADEIALLPRLSSRMEQFRDFVKQTSDRYQLDACVDAPSPFTPAGFFGYVAANDGDAAVEESGVNGRRPESVHNMGKARLLGQWRHKSYRGLFERSTASPSDPPPPKERRGEGAPAASRTECGGSETESDSDVDMCDLADQRRASVATNDNDGITSAWSSASAIRPPGGVARLRVVTDGVGDKNSPYGEHKSGYISIGNSDDSDDDEDDAFSDDDDDDDDFEGFGVVHPARKRGRAGGEQRDGWGSWQSEEDDADDAGEMEDEVS